MEVRKIAEEVAAIVEEKDRSYGSAAAKSGTFLSILFPNGVHPNQYTDMLILVRMFDKMMRIATNPGAFGEDPYRDIVGYALIGEYNRMKEYGSTTEEPWTPMETIR